MYAVIKTGGQQFRAESDKELQVALIDAEQGAEVEFKDVLLVADKENTRVGTPFVDGAVVKGEVVKHIKGKKVNVFHKLMRKDSKKLRGHRQPYTIVKIKEIIGG